jgi:GTPase SAR1 family protein
MSSFKLKVILIGRDLIKNRFIQRIIKNRFAADYKLTVGVDILTKDVEFDLNEFATLSIWDIGCQQRFEFIRSTFYKGAAGIILFFDLTKEETYTEVRNWFTEIVQIIGNRPFLLVGNFLDLLKQGKRVLFRKDVREFVENEGGFYLETASNEIDTIEKAIYTLTRRIIDVRSRNKKNKVKF